ncbi:hypothetical protein PtrM4_118830 [Pyrenophora tritici-repentis]|uniref:BZIP domain-containing protein n=1 Tax=Pyrenophora tritici-repentis TaxID=45151 RepID=A0A834VNE0_9PLEO|nr:hypothetical protein PtrM4_118830 [Pyrenophora tritici-repentis]
MTLTSAQLAEKRKRNRESQQKSRRKIKDEIDTLQCQNRELKQDNLSLKERLQHALTAIEVLRKAQCPDEAVPVTPTDTYFRSPPASGNASAFPQYISHTQGFLSNSVQPSSVLQVDYNSSTECSLPRLTPLRDSFNIGSRPDIGSLYKSKIEPGNSWEYSPLRLSPDVNSTADTLFGEFEEFETQKTR